MTLDLTLLESVKTPDFVPHRAFSLFSDGVTPPAHLLQYAYINHPDDAPIQHQKLLFVRPSFASVFSAYQTSLLHGSDVILVLGKSASVCLPRGRTNLILHADTACKIVPVHGPTKIKVRDERGNIVHEGFVDLSGQILDLKGKRFTVDADKECFIAVDI